MNEDSVEQRQHATDDAMTVYDFVFKAASHLYGEEEVSKTQARAQVKEASRPDGKAQREPQKSASAEQPDAPDDPSLEWLGKWLSAEQMAETAPPPAAPPRAARAFPAPLPPEPEAESKPAPEPERQRRTDYGS